MTCREIWLAYCDGIFSRTEAVTRLMCECGLSYTATCYLLGTPRP